MKKTINTATILIFCCAASFATAQTSWETHRFEPYRIEFKTPPHWQISINTDGEKSFIECYSPDSEIYFFITVAENEKKSDPDIVLQYLKVGSLNSEFIRDEARKINNIDFKFSIGIKTVNNYSTYIRIGVGQYKDKIYMLESGFSRVDSDASEALLDQVISSFKAIR